MNKETTQQKHRLIFSNRIAREIIRNCKFKANLVDITKSTKDEKRTVFVFREDPSFLQYIKEEFNIE